MMNTRNPLCLAVAIALVIVAASYGVLLSAAPPNDIESSLSETKEGDQRFSYDYYGAALKAHVKDQGMVNYKELKAHPERLNAFLATLANLDTETYEEWSDEAKIAFWINAYNALTLKAIIDHYPIKSSFTTSLIYPKNSIRQISGVWDELRFAVMGREMTLDEIEHGTLREGFDEPRIHMALVCAAMGCPPLRNEPYFEEKLGEQLDDQTRRFLANPEKFAIDRNKKQVSLSAIFDWFGGDFVKTYGTDQAFSGHGRSDRAVLNFISKYVEDEDDKFLRTGDYDADHFDYDWTLNEQQQTGDAGLSSTSGSDSTVRGKAGSEEAGWYQRYMGNILAWAKGLGVWGPVVVVIAYIVACVLLIPGSVLTMGAGFLFGVVKGTITVSIASTLGACVAFIIGRTVARKWVTKKISANPKFAALDRAVGQQGFKIILLTRLSPVFPFTLLNYAFGLTKVSFWRYALASWIGMLPGTLMYVYFGSAAQSLTAIVAGGVQEGSAERIFFWLGLVIAVVVATVVTRIARKAFKEAVSEDVKLAPSQAYPE